jgi:hypothetical protein
MDAFRSILVDLYEHVITVQDAIEKIELLVTDNESLIMEAENVS